MQDKGPVWLAIFSTMQRPSHGCLQWHKMPASHHLSRFYQRVNHQTAWLETKRHSGDTGEAPVPTSGELITWLAAEKWHMPALPVNGYAMVGNTSFHWACLQVTKADTWQATGIESFRQTRAERRVYVWEQALAQLVLWEWGPGKPCLPRKDTRRNKVLVHRLFLGV